MLVRTSSKLNRQFWAIATTATLVASSCETGGDSHAEDAFEPEVEWRDAPPNPGQIAQDVAMLRGRPFVLDPSVAVGTLPGVADVGDRGNATWNLPIDPAPGVAGMTPELTINYGSERGNGTLGVGFALGGVSSIRRCTRTIIDGGAAEAILWTNDDALCLGGDRLVLESGVYGNDGAQYRLANDPSVRIVEHAPISNISSWFEVLHGNGHIVVYGTAPATQWRGPDPSFAQPYVWGISQRRDRFANTIDYTYDFPTLLPTGPGEMRLRTIRYAGTGPANTRRELTLDYEARPDEIDTWWFGAHQRMTTRLSRITAKGPNGAVLRSFRLAYETAGDAERSHLANVRMCDAASVCMPPTTFRWGKAPDEEWGNFFLDSNDDIAWGLDQEELAEMLLAMRGTMVTDMDGDLRHELLLRRDGTGISSTMFWRMDDEFSFDLGLPSPPAAPGYLDEEIEDGLYGLPLPAQLARVQPAITAGVMNGDGNRLSDVLTPRTPFGNAVDLDAEGYLYAQGYWLSYGQSTPIGFEPQVIDTITNAVPDPSGEHTYSMIPMDHDADHATDAWLCRGDSALDSHWVLLRSESDGMGASEPFTFHPTDVACSVHDELAVEPLATGAQRLLIIPAYDDEGDPIADADRTSYSRLGLDLETDIAFLEPSLLPRDRYQRWHDRQCRNRIAHGMVGVPVYGAGLGLDRMLDVNGDGLMDVLRFELEGGDDVDDQAAIAADLRPDLTDVDDEEWASPHVCDDDVTIHRDAVIRLWQNTGEGYVDAGAVHEFEGIAHANFWLNFVGSQVMDVTDDGLMDLVLPSSGLGGGWTLLASRGDGTFAKRDTDLPEEGWPAYSSDATWEEAFALGERVRTFNFAKNVDRPGLLFVGFIEDGGEDWPTVANFYKPGGPNEGEHVVEIVDGLGRHTTFEYATVDASEQFAISGPRVPLTAAPWVVSRFCTEIQTEGYGGAPVAADCTDFEYAGAVIDRRGRGLLGFGEVRATGPRGTTWTRHAIEYDAVLDEYPAVGRPLERIIATDVPGSVEVERTNWAYARIATPLVGGDSVLTYASEVRVRNYADGVGSEPDSTELDALWPHAERLHEEERDAFGTVLSSVNETVLGERVETQASDVAHDTVQWLLGQVGRTEVESCAHSGDCKTRVTEATYDGATGLAQTIVMHPGDAELELSTTVQRDGHGNVWQTSSQGAVGQPRVATTHWDTEGVYPTRSVNAAGHESHVVHDVASGAVRAMVAPGGTTKVYRYDGFYRETRADRLATPLGASDGAPPWRHDRLPIT